MPEMTDDELAAALDEAGKRAAAEATKAAKREAEAAAATMREEHDAALAEINTKLADAEQAKLTAEGKVEEAAAAKAQQDNEAVQARIKQAEDKAAAAEATINEMKEQAALAVRDRDVSDAFSDAEFVADSAKTFAVERFVGTLSKDDEGNWTTAAGEGIVDGAKAFMELEDNAFLFADKTPQGTKNTPSSTPRQTTQQQQSRTVAKTQPSGDEGGKSVTEMSDDEILANVDSLTENDGHNWN